jgi:outer membrane protein OmpA-like peptidoglycan-associated protein
MRGLKRNINIILAITLNIAAWLPIPLSAQNQDYKTTFTDAEYYLLFQDYKEALPLYLKLYETNPSNANLNYRIGLCYLNIPGLKQKAIPFLERASTRTTKHYQEGSYKEVNAPDEAIFYLAEAYMVSNMLDRAIDTYTQFRNQLDVKDIYNLDYVNQQIKACEYAQNMMKEPLNVKVERIDPFAERGKYCTYPILSGDRQTMVFTVKEKFYDGIYYCRREGTKWGTPRNITPDLALEGEAYATSLNYDGTLMLIFRNEKGIGNIYLSRLKDNKWEVTQKLSKSINSRDWETFASFTPGGNEILFTSTRKGGYGGLDIYQTSLLPSGQWSNPVNLGDRINTPYNEESPIISADGTTLYFASQGHNSMGRFDLFFSKKLPDNSWSTPVNMGYPINTTDDDLYYFPVDSTTALLSLISSDLQATRELYQVTLSKQQLIPEVLVKGKLATSDNLEVKSDNFTINVAQTDNGDIIASMRPTPASGEFSVKLKPGNYSFTALGDGYEQKTANLYIPRNIQQKTIPLEMTLTPKTVSTGEFVAIKSILFDFDSYALSRDAQFEIEKIYKLMETNPSLYIEVTGHTDSKGSAAYNQRLSVKRARAVIEYLVNKGIDEKRFVARGAGSLDNVAANTNPDGSDNPVGRSLNRRVCMRVLKSDRNIEIAEDIDIPEHLKVNEQKYTILLGDQNTKIDPGLVNNLQSITGQSVRTYEVGSTKYITLGMYSNKPSAINDLNKCIDNGFANATIVGESSLNQMINTKKMNFTSAKATYTIQLFALNKPADNSMLRGLKATETKGDDGYFRYLYGEFKTWEMAQKELERILDMGFTEAFVVNVERFK